MKVEVNLFASLSRYKPEHTRGDSWLMDLNDGITVEELLQLLNVPGDEVKLIFINGVHVERDTILKNGDRVGIFPPVGGG